MSRNILWGMIVVLLVTNVLTFTLVKTSETKTDQSNEQAIPAATSDFDSKIIAKVGEKNITYNELIKGLEEKFGEEYLNNLLDQEVVFQLAEQEGIAVSEAEIKKEIDMFKAVYQGGVDPQSYTSEEELHRDVEYMLLVEELLTKDIVISENDVKEYYQSNKELFTIPTTYRASHIVVNTKAEIEDVVQELKNGSSFSVLAMERSTDVFSAREGGDLGYIAPDNGSIPKAYFGKLAKLKEDTWSKPIETKNGYAIVYLHDILEGKSYNFDEVKNQIRRQLALQQTEGSLSVKALWNEIGVEVFYPALNRK